MAKKHLGVQGEPPDAGYNNDGSCDQATWGNMVKLLFSTGL